MIGSASSWNGRAVKAAVIAAVATSVVSALFSSGVIPKLFQPITRPDPFTGTQGAALERRIADLERRVRALEGN